MIKTLKRKTKTSLFKYSPKTTFTGYKIGLGTPDLYVGVPTKYFRHGNCFVQYENRTENFSLKEKATEVVFNDRFVPNATYTLAYFLWKKVSKKEVEPKPIQEELL